MTSRFAYHLLPLLLLALCGGTLGAAYLFAPTWRATPFSSGTADVPMIGRRPVKPPMMRGDRPVVPARPTPAPGETAKPPEAVKPARPRIRLVHNADGGMQLDPESLGALMRFKGSVTGKVTDAAGAPVAGAGVFCDLTLAGISDAGEEIRMEAQHLEELRDGPAAHSEIRFATTFTDDKGEFKLTVEREVHEAYGVHLKLWAEARGHGRSRGVELALVHDRAEEATLVLRVAGTLRGRVVDAQSVGIADARVTICDRAKACGLPKHQLSLRDYVTESSSLNLSGSHLDSYPNIPNGSLNSYINLNLLLGPEENFAARTDTQGYFVVEDVPVGEWYANAEFSGMEQSPEAPRVSIAAGPNDLAAPLQLSVNMSLSVTLHNRQGEPVSGHVAIELCLADGGVVYLDGTATENGELHFCPARTMVCFRLTTGQGSKTVNCDFATKLSQGEDLHACLGQGVIVLNE